MDFLLLGTTNSCPKRNLCSFWVFEVIVGVFLKMEWVMMNLKGFWSTLAWDRYKNRYRELKALHLFEFDEFHDFLMHWSWKYRWFASFWFLKNFFKIFDKFFWLFYIFSRESRQKRCQMGFKMIETRFYSEKYYLQFNFFENV